MRNYFMGIFIAILAGGGIAATTKAAPAIPEKWFERAKGFEQALALQKETQADILLFIASRNPAGPAKRSGTFEDRMLRHKIMRPFLRAYIIVKLSIPDDPDTNKLAKDRFRVEYGPRLFLIKPNQFTTGVRIQLGEGDEREWVTLEQLQRNIITQSSPAYENKGITAAP